MPLSLFDKISTASKDNHQNHVADAQAMDLVPGNEFQVNLSTAYDQSNPSIAGLANGGFAIAWMSDEIDGASYNIYAQRYDSNGTPLGIVGNASQVNTAGNGRYPSVAGLTNGGFVIAWQGADSSYSGVYARLYNSNGAAQNNQFLVNTYEINDQAYPAAAGTSDGGFVITWESAVQDNDSWGIYAQRYDNHGIASGSEFRVNTVTFSDQDTPAIAAFTDGGFVATWVSDWQDGTPDLSVFAQRYDTSGLPFGSEFEANAYTSNNQLRPTLAGQSNQSFIITWYSYGNEASGAGIFARGFYNTGAYQSTEFQVNTFTTNDQMNPTVAALNDGGYVVTWWGRGLGDTQGIYGQRYDSIMNPVDSEFQINTFITSTQQNPSVAALKGGGFAVTWQSNIQDSDGWGIYAKMFTPPSPPSPPSPSVPPHLDLSNLYLLLALIGVASVGSALGLVASCRYLYKKNKTNPSNESSNPSSQNTADTLFDSFHTGPRGPNFLDAYFPPKVDMSGNTEEDRRSMGSGTTFTSNNPSTLFANDQAERQSISSGTSFTSVNSATSVTTNELPNKVERRRGASLPNVNAISSAATNKLPDRTERSSINSGMSRPSTATG